MQTLLFTEISTRDFKESFNNLKLLFMCMFFTTFIIKYFYNIDGGNKEMLNYQFGDFSINQYITSKTS